MASTQLLLSLVPNSCEDRRTCLQRYFKEDFKVLNILTAHISCETSMLVIITTIWRQAIAGKLKKHVTQAYACDPQDLYGDQALN